MKQKHIDMYMDWAKRTSELSSAIRLQVGAVIVKDDSVISYGYNGTPAGWDNTCEYKEFMNSDVAVGLDPEEIKQRWPFEARSDEDDAVVGRYSLVTKPEVLHAEMNSLMKLAKSTRSGNQASMFVTHAPCIECAKGIYQSGIKEVFYNKEYRANDGIEFLRKCGIKVEKLNN